MTKNENGHYWGLHIVQIDPQNGVVENAKVFDTYDSSKYFDEFIQINKEKGRIIIAACKDEC